MPPIPIPPAGLSGASVWDGSTYLTVASPPIALATPIATDDGPTVKRGDRLDLFTGADPIPAAIQRQLFTRRGSGVAVLNDGLDRLAGAKNDKTAPTLLIGVVRQVLQPFADAGYITIDSITSTGGPGSGWMGSVTATYTDKTTGRKHILPPPRTTGP